MVKKIDLAKEAVTANAAGEVEGLITDEVLLDMCPKSVLLKFKKLKTPAARADFLYELNRGELKQLRGAYNEMDTFVTRLEQWFIQELTNDQTGVTGKVGRVEVKNKEVASVSPENWPVFYAHIKRRGEFDLLNKAINQKAVQERWAQGKEVPGVGKFVKKVISLTAVK